MKNIVLFASGAGSNAENIIQYFNENNKINVVGVFTNRTDSGVIQKANKHAIPVFTFNKEQLCGGEIILRVKAFNPTLIVLAGFLLKLPSDFVNSFPNQIINIHPALLPKYGGKGMYGDHVHRAVLENKEIESGISIHYVDEHFDNGDIIFQAKTDVSSCSSSAEIAQKVHQLEHEFFPSVIEKLL